MKHNVGNDYTVYIHTNKVNGKVYIGQTCQSNLNVRWNNGYGYKQCPRFYSAIQKYGWNGFTHGILETGLTKEEADDKERFYIALYRSNDWRFGYNVQYGGQDILRGEYSPVSKRIDVYDLEGKFIATFATVTQAAKFIGAGSAYVCTKCKMRSGTVKGYICHYNSLTQGMEQLPEDMVFKPNDQRNLRKPVAQYSPEGKLIKIFPSVKQAAKETGAKKAEISSCLCNPDERISTGGFMWRYADNAPETIPPMPFEPHEEGVHLYARAVLQLDRYTGEVIAEYSSIKEAAQAVGAKKTSIWQVMNGQAPTSHGYKWTYKYPKQEAI